MTISHDPQQNYFFAELDNERAHVAYIITNNIMTITSTFVPPAFRGRGMAAKLVTAAMEYARAENLQVIGQCSYVPVFWRRYPQYADLKA